MTSKPDEFEERLLSAVEVPNRHICFFQGLIPSLETFDDDEVVEFQIGVLGLIKQIKQAKKQEAASLMFCGRNLQVQSTDLNAQHFNTHAYYPPNASFSNHPQLLNPQNVTHMNSQRFNPPNKSSPSHPTPTPSPSQISFTSDFSS